MQRGSGDNTKEQLRQSAAELFSVKGYATVSVQEIVEHAGVTKGAFYHHFNGKEDVFFDFFGEFCRDHLEQIRPIADADLTAVDAASQMVQEMVTSIARYRHYCVTAIRELRLLDDPNLNPERTAEMRSLVAEMVELWTKVVRRGMEAGEFQMVDAPEAVAFAFFTMPVFVFGFLDRTSPIAVEEAGKMFAEAALGGLLGRNRTAPEPRKPGNGPPSRPRDRPR